MKRFLNKFSSNEAKEKGGLESIHSWSSKSLNGVSNVVEKSTSLEGVPARVRLSNGGEKVRSLAARFESLSGFEGQQQKLEAAPPSMGRSSLMRQGRAVNDKIGVKRSSAVSLEISLPVLSRQEDIEGLEPAERACSPVLGDGITSPDAGKKPDQRKKTIEPVARSTALSQISVSNGTKDEVIDKANISEESCEEAQHSNNRSVAFAPSPQKPMRSVSPRIGGRADSEDSVIAHFAKPTAASSARAKSTSRINSIDSGMQLASSSNLQSPSSALDLNSINRPSSSLSISRVNTIKRSLSSGGSVKSRGNTSNSNAHKVPSDDIDSAAFSRVRSSDSTNARLPRNDSPISFINGSSCKSVDTEILHRSASPQNFSANSSRFTIGNNTFAAFDSRRSSCASRNDSTGSIMFAWSSNGAKSVGGPKWSEMTQKDLVCNLSARERTRQEVLWEIVASEERYVCDLRRTKELYIDALLHPLHSDTFKTTSISSLTSIDTPQKQHSSSSLDLKGGDLPIAAHHMIANSSIIDSGDTPKIIDFGSSEAYHSTFRSSKRTSNGITSPLFTSPTSKTFSRSSKMASREDKRCSNSKSVKANDTRPAASPQLVRALKAKERRTEVFLSNSLRITMEAISNGLLEIHLLLLEALKRRYEQQWPLVRSLADVFAEFSNVWQYYKDYVNHLERALDTLEEATLMERAMRGKRFKKDKLPSSVALGRALLSLESAAVGQGECSLAIFLAMPFQRLLKYPLLFQNLLFHTDASTYEFERTVQMVIDVEHLVRSIEDEKINKEERDKVIDAFARIEGIKDKSLLRPKGDRFLIEEKALYERNPQRANSDSREKESTNQFDQLSSNSASFSYRSHQADLAAFSIPSSSRSSLKDKYSSRRLSDFLISDDRQKATKAPNFASKKDLWSIRFSDVEIKCRRVGVTSLPMVSSIALQWQEDKEAGQNFLEKTEGEADAAMKQEEDEIKEEFKRSKEAKERMKALRNNTLRNKTRNLYKFISVSNWKQIQKKNTPSLEHLLALSSPQEIDEEGEEDDEDEDDDDRSSHTSLETDEGMLDSERYIRQSKLSFSYRGQDRVEPNGTSNTMMTRAQSQHVPAINRTGDADKFKRHSHHSTDFRSTAVSTIGGPSPSLSKSILTKAYSKPRVDKFGSRMRQGDEYHSRGILDRMKRSDEFGVVEREEIPSPSQNHSKAMIETQANSIKVQTMVNSGKRQSMHSAFSRDQSIDSNLRLMGLLINEGGDKCVWR